MIDDALFLSILRYCKMEDHQDDPVVIDEVGEFVEAAINYLSGGGIERTESNSALWLQAVKALVCHWYDNRSLIGTGVSLPLGAREIINQLKMRGGGALGI